MAHDTVVSTTTAPLMAYDFTTFCHQYDTSKSKMYELCRLGKGPKRRWLGGKLLIGRADAIAWFESLPAHQGDRAA